MNAPGLCEEHKELNSLWVDDDFDAVKKVDRKPQFETLIFRFNPHFIMNASWHDEEEIVGSPPFEFLLVLLDKTRIKSHVWYPPISRREK